MRWGLGRQAVSDLSPAMSRASRGRRDPKAIGPARIELLGAPERQAADGTSRAISLAVAHVDDDFPEGCVDDVVRQGRCRSQTTPHHTRGRPPRIRSWLAPSLLADVNANNDRDLQERFLICRDARRAGT